MDLNTLAFIVIVCAIVGALPGWGWHSYRYYPSGGLFLFLLLIVLFMHYN